MGSRTVSVPACEPEAPEVGGVAARCAFSRASIRRLRSSTSVRETSAARGGAADTAGAFVPPLSMYAATRPATSSSLGMISPRVPACTNTWREPFSPPATLAHWRSRLAPSPKRVKDPKRTYSAPTSRATVCAAPMSVVALAGSSTRITAISFTWPSRDASMSERPARRNSGLSVECTTTARIATRVCPAAKEGAGTTALRAATQNANFQPIKGTSPGGLAAGSKRSKSRVSLPFGGAGVKRTTGSLSSGWEPHAKPGPLPFLAHDLDRSAMIRDDAVTDHETETRPLVRVFRRKERIEDSFEVVRGDARAGIADFQHRFPPFCPLRRIGADSHLSARGRRVDRVHHQIE